MRSNKRFLIPIFLTYFLDNFGLAITYPIFTPLIVNSNINLFATTSSLFTRSLTFGLLLSAFPIAQCLGAPLIGRWSDYFGRKSTLYYTIFGASVGYALTGCAIYFHTFSLLFIGRFLTGIFAANLPICLAAIADMCPDETKRSQNYGHISALAGLSFICAILAGEYLIDPTLKQHFNPAYTFWITAALSFVNFILMSLLFKETLVIKTKVHNHPFRGILNLKIAFSDPTLLTLNLANFLFKISWIPALLFLPNFLKNTYSFSGMAITSVLISVGLMWALTNWFINQCLSFKVHPKTGFLYCLAGLSLIAFLVSISWPSSIFLTFFYLAVGMASLCWTTSLTTLSLNTSSSMQGGILGVNQSITTIAAMTGPVIGHLLITIWPMLLYFFFTFCNLFAFFLIAHRWKKLK